MFLSDLTCILKESMESQIYHMQALSQPHITAQRMLSMAFTDVTEPRVSRQNGDSPRTDWRVGEVIAMSPTAANTFVNTVRFQ